MNDNAVRILADIPERDSVSVFFMGQAGLIIKSNDGRMMAIDLYLSDCCERYHGFKRLAPKPINAGDVVFDAVLASHAHYDHFDVDSIPLLTANPKTKLCCANDCRDECARLGIDGARVTFMDKHELYRASGFDIRTVDCDHGAGTPDALGFVIRVNGKTVYFTGDTAFSENIAREVKKDGEEIDVMFVPINGAFGNLNAAGAARFASLINPKLTVPIHFWMFAEHGGNPGTFAEIMRSEYPSLPYKFMTMGEKLSL